MTDKLNFRTDPEFTVFALLAAWKLCPRHLHLHHNLHQVNNYTWFYIHQLCFHHRMNSWLTVAEVFMANPHFIPTFNIYYQLLSRLFYPDREHFHLFAALKDIVGSATPSSPGCRAGGGSWSTSCPSWSSGHQDSSPVTHPDICK